MKRFLFIVLALGIIVTFSGCDWFLGLINAGTADLEVETVWAYEEYGMVDYVDITFYNSGSKDVEDAEFLIVFSTDTDINIWDDTTIYLSTTEVNNDDWSYVTVEKWEIDEYISTNSVSLAAQEGYIGVYIDPNEDIEEKDEGNNSNYGTDMTAVPSIDADEPNDGWTSATDIAQYGVDHPFAFFPDNDVDWFSFHAWDGGVTYDISTSQVGGVEINTYIELYDRDGTTLIDFNDDAGGTLFSGITGFDADFASATGTYYIKVTETTGATGLYQLRITEY